MSANFRPPLRPRALAEARPPILRDQLDEEAAGDQGMDTDAKPATFSRRCHACGLHRMVELIDTYGYPLDEMTSGLG